MKALIYKDLLAVWKYCRMYLFMCAAFLISSVFVEAYSFLQMYPLILMGMLVNTLIAYDEHDKWERLVLTMPVSRKQYVTAKYLMGLTLQGTVLLLTAGAHALQLVLAGKFVWEAFQMDLVILLVIASAAPSLMLPFVFRNGSEKGRMAYLIVIGTVFGLAAAGSIILKKLDLMHRQVAFPGGLLVVVLVVLLYLGSWALSVRWYEKREF